HKPTQRSRHTTDHAKRQAGGLAVPPEHVIATSDDSRPDDYARQAVRARARKKAALWSAAGLVGFVVSLFGIGLPYVI
ncbi:hypothetical protein, partial [Actinomadura geliboluensis]|uniref:hypothetical protein n=1 Tax=Actinomadura geliboluensis TaxID=882440 RepID=UPI00148708D3